MAAHPVPGLVFINPTAAAAGGTQLRGIFDDQVEFEDGTEVEHHGGGLEADSWVTTRKQGRPAVLLIPVRDVSSTTIQLLLGLLSTGTGADSNGGTGIGVHGVPPAVSLAIRPRDTGQDYFYSPRMVLHERSVKRIVWSRTVPKYDGSVLALCPERSLDGTKQAYKLGTAAAINTTYGL